LLKHLSRLFGTTRPAGSQRHAAIEFMLAHLQQLLQQRTLARAQEVGHGGSHTIIHAPSSPALRSVGLIGIKPAAGAAGRVALPRMRCLISLSW
jgi:hypothetical protein